MKIKFSVIIPFYNVEAYVPALLKSLDDQVKGNYDIEYIFIDDGSPDNSKVLLADWVERNPAISKLIVQENQGVSAARNNGIELATGNWITFPDSDDFLDRNYFVEVAKFIESDIGSQSTIVGTNIVRYFDSNHQYMNSHALRFKFRGGNKLVDLGVKPNFIQMSAPTTFFRSQDIETSKNRFKLGLHASEDALFTAEILLRSGEPKLGLVTDAKYYYRKRASGDSAIDSFRGSADSYLTRFRDGYLPLLERAVANYGQVPSWLVSQLTYEYRWLFGAETAVHSRSNALSDEERREFIELAQRMLTMCGSEQVASYAVTTIHKEVILVLRALAGEEFPTQTVQKSAVDKDQELVQLSYFFTGDLPSEHFMGEGESIAPVHEKIRRLNFFGQERLKERIIWIKHAEDLVVELDGVQLRVGPIPNGRPSRVKSDAALDAGITYVKSADSGLVPDKLQSMHRALEPRGLETPLDVLRRALVGFKKRTAKSVSLKRNLKYMKFYTQRQIFARRLLSPVYKERYQNSWLLMDRLDAAGDNAEHVYRYLLKNRKDINAWFVLRRSSKDWAKLEAEGFKMLEYGSLEHKTALTFADHVVSSHIDIEMTNPMPGRAYPKGRAPFKFTFLQHGVTKDDLSLWINNKNLDLVIAATSDEYEGFVGDETGYRLTTKQVKLTGFPRFDALNKVTKLLENHTPEYLLVAPTWRHTLVKPKVRGTGERLPSDTFQQSDFYMNWMEVLGGKQLIERAERLGLTVAFLPHPNLESSLSAEDIDPRITVFSYRDDNVQEIFANTRILVTDYSSIAFDLAFIGAEIHYFQFDADTIFAGDHTMMKGYFEYPRDGFGPVHYSSTTLFGGMDGIGFSYDAPDNEFASRAQNAFLYRDAGACERVTSEIEALRRVHGE